MHNHIHLIWQPQYNHEPSNIQQSFMKYTAQQIKLELMKDNPELIEKCKVNKYDRTYQIWKRGPLCIDLFTEAVYLCKYPKKTYRIKLDIIV